jgi:hypothetical protein
MKNLLKICAIAFTGILMAGVVVSCEKTPGGGGGGETDNTLEVDPTALTFTAAEETKTVTVTSALEWTATATTGGEWLTITKGEGSFTVKASTNSDNAERNGVIAVRNGVAGESKTIAVKQAGDPILKILSVFGQYRQDRYKNEESNFFMGMYTAQTDEFGYPQGAGYLIEFDFFSNFPASELRPDIAPGTYTVDNSMGNFTAIAGESKIHTLDESGTVSLSKKIESGSFKVEKQGSEYIITVDVVNEDGENIEARFQGTPQISHPFYTSFFEDAEITGLTKSRVFWYGDDYDTGAWHWYIELGGPGIILAEPGSAPSGSGDHIKLEFYSPKEGDGTYIPTGEYTFLAHPTQGGPYKKAPYEALAGYYGMGAGGSWYLAYPLSSGVAPFISGKMTISRNGDKHIIEVDALDDAGNNITSRFEGVLQIYNLSTRS